MSYQKTQLNLGLIQFKGSDAEKFLQGQLTCDVTALTEDRIQPGAYCSPQGRIRANFFLVQTSADVYLMILPTDQVSFLLETMTPYVAFFQTEMSDVTAEFEIMGISEELTSEKNAIQWSDALDLQQPVNQWQRTSQNNLSCIKLPSLLSQWLVLNQLEQQDQTLDLSQLTELSFIRWVEAQLRSGHIWIDSSNRDHFLPHDISLPALGAVSFTKGCYAGQEIVARMHYRGDPKYQLVLLDIETVGLKNTDCEIPNQLIIQNDDQKPLKIGKVVSKLELEDNNWCIAASIKKTISTEEQIQLSFCDETYPCRVSLPSGIVPVDSMATDAQGAK